MFILRDIEQCVKTLLYRVCEFLFRICVGSHSDSLIRDGRTSTNVCVWSNYCLSVTLFGDILRRLIMNCFSVVFNLCFVLILNLKC